MVISGFLETILESTMSEENKANLDINNTDFFSCWDYVQLSDWRETLITNISSLTAQMSATRCEWNSALRMIASTWNG